jgi:hypothetical protein
VIRRPYRACAFKGTHETNGELFPKYHDSGHSDAYRVWGIPSG